MTKLAKELSFFLATTVHWASAPWRLAHASRTIPHDPNARAGVDGSHQVQAGLDLVGTIDPGTRIRIVRNCPARVGEAPRRRGPVHGGCEKKGQFLGQLGHDALLPLLPGSA